MLLSVQNSYYTTGSQKAYQSNRHDLICIFLDRTVIDLRYCFRLLQDTIGRFQLWLCGESLRPFASPL